MDFCTKCSMERGVTSYLQPDGGGILVCRIDPKHRFKLDAAGFLVSAD